MTEMIKQVSVSDGTKPKVTIHVPKEEHIQQKNSDELTLACLVSWSSHVLQDFYIAWTESIKDKTSTYADGINSLPQETQNGYVVTSVYTTNKTKWRDHTFHCHVWSADDNEPQSSTVSYAQGNSIECDKK